MKDWSCAGWWEWCGWQRWADIIHRDVNQRRTAWLAGEMNGKLIPKTRWFVAKRTTCDFHTETELTEQSLTPHGHSIGHFGGEASLWSTKGDKTWEAYTAAKKIREGTSAHFNTFSQPILPPSTHPNATWFSSEILALYKSLTYSLSYFILLLFWTREEIFKNEIDMSEFQHLNNNTSQRVLSRLQLTYLRVILCIWAEEVLHWQI